MQFIFGCLLLVGAVYVARIIDERLTTDLIVLAFILPAHVMSATAKARFHREAADEIPDCLDASANDEETRRKTSILLAETDRRRTTQRNGWLHAVLAWTLIGIGLLAAVIVLIEILS